MDISDMKLDKNFELQKAFDCLVKNHAVWKNKKKKRIENHIKYGILLDEKKDVKDFANKISSALENVWKTQHYAMLKNALDNVNEDTYVAEVLTPILTATFSELPVSANYQTNWGETESLSSKARKQGHVNKPDFKLRVKLGDKKLELVNMETSRPEFDLRKQKSNHNRLARGAKDTFEYFSISKNQKKFEFEELAKIFYLNIKGKYLSIHVFSQTKEKYYCFVKIDQAEIPLFQSKPEKVYKLMQLLLELR
ncbi:18715_t:CDS:2, partial [Acaulospora morrowiae]